MADTSDNKPQNTIDHAGPAPALSRRQVLQAAGAASAAATLSSQHAAAKPVAESPSANMATIELVVNGKAQKLEIDTRLSLLDLLRERLDLTGAKKGCNQGACGACTILVEGKRINSCLALAVMHDGAEITTIEGLAGGDALHPLQAAFIEYEGLQCGYCTPGQILSGAGCIAEGHATSEEEIKFWMSGNICRCGAYSGIVAAIAETSGRS